VLETEAAARLCAAGPDTDRASLDALAAIWLVAPEDRLQDMAQVGALDEAFHCTLVGAAGNGELARVHREVSERIRIIRRLDFTKPARVAATYEEHGKILRAILAKRGEEACRMLRAHIAASQLEVRKITLHEVYMARHQAHLSHSSHEPPGGQH
jgi:DNA-binding GntR family transcriptional regulator